jgi:hypothetical protein
VTPAKAAAVVIELFGEKRRKGYRNTPWPDSLRSPEDEADPLKPTFGSEVVGVLPGDGATSVGGIFLPIGRRKRQAAFLARGAPHRRIHVSAAFVEEARVQSLEVE